MAVMGFSSRQSLNVGAALVARGEFTIILAQLAAGNAAIALADRSKLSAFAGLYVLVNRANPDGLLRELRYDNNAASVRLRLTRAAGIPQVHVLRSCEGAERC